MKVLKFLILFVSILVFSVRSADKYLIIGAGPVGLYLAHDLLSKNPSSNVEIVEGRLFNRPQCIRLPYAIAVNFPKEVKEALWPVLSIREMIFSVITIPDKNLSQILGYQNFPRISVGNLQKTFKEYLEFKYPTRFTFKKMSADVDYIQNQSKEEKKIIFFTAGDGAFNEDLRISLDVPVKVWDFTDKEYILDGVYLIYRNNKDGDPLRKFDEDYRRNGQFMNRFDLSRHGLTYSASNDEQRDVQVYTYPVGILEEIYTKMPESIKTSTRFPQGLNYKTGHILTEAQRLNPDPSTLIKIRENEWLEELRNILDKLFETFEIYIPPDAKLHYARRIQYAYANTHSQNKNGVDVVFVGDSMGGTDYKYGLNLGRGLYSAYNLVEFLTKTQANVPYALEEYQKYWNNVIATEFGDYKKDLIAKSEIFYKYVVMGRTVNGKVLGIDDLESFK